MRRAGIFAIIAVTSLQAALADVVRHPTLPKSILAAWAANSEACANPDRSAVVLSAHHYVSPEMSCGIQSVSESPGPHGPIYSARMQCAGKAAPAQTAATSVIFVPMDADHLSAGSDFDNLTTYQRCPSPRK
jgi:hypothetical protein